MLDLAPEEDLDLDDLFTAHRGEFGIAVTFSSLQPRRVREPVPKLWLA